MNCSGCGKELHVDHVIMLTTKHMRRFCSVECIILGRNKWLEERLGLRGD